MLYRIVRWIASIALEWFYRDIEVTGLERIPPDAPLLLAVNHPNALVDALVVMHMMPRRILITAKATLFGNPLLRAVFPHIGIIPLRRLQDEKKSDPARTADAERNAESFRAILDSLAQHKAVLIFPEGITHNQPTLAPLKTGLARLALQAKDERGVRGLIIVPIGLTFERKWAPRTRILAHVGDPIGMDTWKADVEGPAAAEELTREVDRRLRAQTLNFSSIEDANRVLGASRILAGAFGNVRPLGAPDLPLASEAEIVRRIAAAQETLSVTAAERAHVFLTRLEALREELARRRIAVNDVLITPGVREGAWFAIREGAIIAITGPIAWWGRINHWAPLAITRAIAQRASKSTEDPAMYSLVLGAALVLVAYGVQTAIVWRLAGMNWALLYLISLPIAASWDFRFRDRMRRAAKRMRTYFLFRSDETLRHRLATELEWVRNEAIALEALARPYNGGSESISTGETSRQDPSARRPGVSRYGGPSAV
ncbi:MAG: lysophospholipid acyltransferase family protein [Gemmatimonadaceae bacterium]